MYPIIAGVQFDGKQHQFNYDSNNANDILELVSPQMYQSNIHNYIY